MFLQLIDHAPDEPVTWERDVVEDLVQVFCKRIAMNEALRETEFVNPEEHGVSSGEYGGMINELAFACARRMKVCKEDLDRVVTGLGKDGRSFSLLL